MASTWRDTSGAYAIAYWERRAIDQNYSPIARLVKREIPAPRGSRKPIATDRALRQRLPNKNVLDHEKGEGAEEVDPHVLALALRLKREGYDVTALTRERRDRPRVRSQWTVGLARHM